ncbi:GTP-binding protein [Microbacterium sp. VKM Ac-2870]|uniref:CobW family GTP-binding protein n=1 Tax=Microbacterium sp. VKM Ac-2870 TaxID=2783825 RepID=UPI001889D95D|nr:GTP-binding protein [Microbacterium sp. VKM Ac-2870]MBF4563196.1 GTP-binding protein [Microbacterium sp. VKM Ac-2870]
MSQRQDESSPPHAAASRVPVIAVTGHLGAGKTSLVNHLLRAPGARIGVVVNDFGALNVDAGLVTGQVDEASAISGGCVCCLPDAGGLDDALARLADPRLRLDAIIVEASGFAEPTVLARLIRFSGVERVRPGGVIEVIDAVNHFTTIDSHDEPPPRYAAASLVVIGKTDLLAPRERASTLERITDRVRARNRRAQIVAARAGAVDPRLVFDVADHDDPADELPIAQLLRHDVDPTPEHRPGHGHHSHEHACSAAVALAAPVSPTALVDLLEQPPEGAYRMKGRVRVRGTRSDRGYVVNVVAGAIHVAPLPSPPSPGELVAIGIHLDEQAAHARLAAVSSVPAERADAAGLRRLQRYRRLSE